MNILQFMQIVFKDDRETYLRCLNKASIIVYDGKHLLLGDSQYIYYFGSLDRSFGSSYRFYKLVKNKMKNKILFATRETYETYSNHCEILGTANNGDLKCIWKG